MRPHHVQGPGVFHTADRSTTGLNDPALWSTDGTAAGTRVFSEYPTRPFVFNEQLYFRSATGISRTDGTTAGTVPTGLTGSPSGVTNGKLLFSNHDPAAPTSVYELWASDGTSAGSVRLSDSFNSSFFLPTRVYFGKASNGTQELWSSDGTVTGTQRVRVLGPGTTYAAVNFHGSTLPDDHSLRPAAPCGAPMERKRAQHRSVQLLCRIAERPGGRAHRLRSRTFSMPASTNLLDRPRALRDSERRHGSSRAAATPPALAEAEVQAAVGAALEWRRSEAAPATLAAAVAGAAAADAALVRLCWLWPRCCPARFVRNSRQATDARKNLSPAVNNL